MSYTTATVTGTHQKPDGTPASGRVEFIPNSPVRQYTIVTRSAT